MIMILRNLEQHFFELFGVRNLIYLDGINARIDLQHVGWDLRSRSQGNRSRCVRCRPCTYHLAILHR